MKAKRFRSSISSLFWRSKASSSSFPLGLPFFLVSKFQCFYKLGLRFFTGQGVLDGLPFFQSTAVLSALYSSVDPGQLERLFQLLPCRNDTWSQLHFFVPPSTSLAPLRFDLPLSFAYTFGAFCFWILCGF